MVFSEESRRRAGGVPRWGEVRCLALGLMVAAGAATVSSAATLMALTFDEGPQPSTSPKPFTTADISGKGNHAFIQDDGGQPLFGGPAFNAAGAPQIPNFELSDGSGNGPAGPFGPGSPGSYLNLYANHVDLTPAGTPGRTPNNDLTFTGDFTVEFWFRTGENGFNMFQLNQVNGVVGIIGLFMNTDGTIEAKLNSDTTEYGGFSSTGVAYNDVEWHHVAVVRNAALGRADMFLDGGSVNGGQDVVISTSLSGTDTFSEPWSFAHRVNGWGDNARKSIWQIDELRISDVALAESELGFHQTIVPPPPPATDPTPVPVIYFTFDQTHTGMQTGGNGLAQLRLRDFMERQDGIVVGPFSNYDTPANGQTFFFDDQPGGGSSIGNGLAKFGGALHLRTLLPEGWGIILGDSVVSNADYIVGSTTENLFDRAGDQEWTLEFWYRGKLDEPHGLFGHSDGANVPRLQVDLLKEGSSGAGPGDTGKVRTIILNENETISLTMLTMGTGFGDNAWHHYALVRSVEPGGTNNDFFTVYIDGGSGKGGETVQAVADETLPGFVDWSDPAKAPFPDNSPSMFFIGRTYSGADGGDDFDIDDFAYFTQALTVEQLGYNKPAFTPPPQGTLFIIGE